MTAATVEETLAAERTTSPYKGLVPYMEAERDALYFFGREDERDVLIANLLASRLTILNGKSGVGKTSVLRAGVVHELRARARDLTAAGARPEFVVAVYDYWPADPVVGVQQCIRAAVEEVFGDAAPPPVPVVDSLGDALAEWTRRLDCELLLVLDQFDEYFLYHEHEDGPGTFAVELPRAVRRLDVPVSFLISIRDDALAKLERFKNRIPILFDNLLHIDHLGADAARRAIEGPIERYNELDRGDGPAYRIEDGVADEVLAAVRVAGTPAGAPEPVRIEAPYLQLVMARLWSEEQAAGSNVLQLATLRRVGGARAIVAAHLDDALNALRPRELEQAALLLEHLVTPSGTKIALTLGDLAWQAKTGEEVLLPLLDYLRRRRIVRSVAPPPGDASGERFEVPHDVLAAAILDWRTRFEERRKVRRERRRRALVAGGSAAAVLIGAGFAVLGLSISSANDAAAKSKSRERAGVALRELGTDSPQAVADALGALDTHDTAEAEDALRAALAAAPERPIDLRGHRGTVATGAFGANGRRILTGGADGTLRVWDAASGRELGRLRRRAAVASAAFDGDGKRAVALFGNGNAVVWDTTRPAADAVTLHDASPASSASISADGKLVVTALVDGTARVRDARTGKVVADLRSGGGLFDATFSPDGKRVVTAGIDGAVRVWDVRRDARPLVLRGHTGPVSSAVFGPHGDLILTASDDGTARVWDTRTGVAVRVLRTRASSVRSAVFDPTGRVVLTLGSDGAARVWSADDGALVTVLRSGDANVVSGAFGDGGRVVVTVGDDGSAQVWDATSGARLDDLRGARGPLTSAQLGPGGDSVLLTGADGLAEVRALVESQPAVAIGGAGLPLVRAAAFSADGKRIVTAGADGAARIWDAASGLPLRVLESNGVALASAAFSPDGGRVVTVDGLGTARIWRLATLHATRIDRFAATAAFDAKGERVVTGDYNGGVRVFDARTGKQVATLRKSDPVAAAAFAPDGGSVVFATSGGVSVWRWRDAGGAPAPIANVEAAVRSLAFSRDGSRLVTAGDDGAARVWWWHHLGWKPVALFGDTGAIASAQFGPDAKLLVTAGVDGTARVFGSTGTEVTVVRAGAGPVAAVAFSADGRRILVVDGGRARVYDCAVCAPLPELRRRAKAYLSRGK